MLRWALTFFIVAIVAALFGFTGIAASAAWIGQILFFLFAAIFVICFVAELAKHWSPLRAERRWGPIRKRGMGAPEERPVHSSLRGRGGP